MPATKKRRRGQPHKVLHLSSYGRLEAYLRTFAEGHFHLLILVGAGGLAKSRSVRAALNGKAAGSRATPPRSACMSGSTGTGTRSSSSTTSMPAMRIEAACGY